MNRGRRLWFPRSRKRDLGHPAFLKQMGFFIVCGTADAVESGSVNLHLFVAPERCQRGGENRGSGRIGDRADAVMHPLTLAARGDDTGVAQVGEMARDFGLALAEYLDKMADTDLATGHQVQEAQAGGVGQRSEETGQADRFGAAAHKVIIYVLTHMSVYNKFA